ncbi:hypothetical protein KIW84_070653 [Lathyrus oleraceus]|uniref:Uncharacterized protein n=1 Tax=Pisum sativum TaxID=3888 RepID=A0A9D4VGR5_PEA|nr:hypothetical protein KIW84_070653 [Pisum sativum]
MVSPTKQMAYIESSHCISPVKTNSDKAFKRVRNRLNFDSSDMPQRLDSDKSWPNEISITESNNEVQLYDIDFPNFDALSMDFSFAEMLNALDFSCEGLDFSCDPTPIHSNDNQVISEQPSTLEEALSEKNMNIQGTDSLTAMTSVTRNFVALVSLLRLHPNHLVTGSSAATYIFLLQHGNAEVVDEVVTLLIEELELLKSEIGNDTTDSDQFTFDIDSKTFSRL